MKKSAVITGLVSVVALLVPLSLFAAEAEEPPPPLSEVWMVVPKTGMEAQFYEAVEADKVFREQGGDSRDWNAYTVAIGHNMNVVQFRACCFNWADQDTYEADSREKELGKNWSENVHQYVDHYHHYFEYADWENSNWSEGENDGPYYGVTTWTAKQGAGPASGEARKKMSQLASEGGWDSDWLWLSRVGGRPMTAVVSSYANYADMEPPEQNFFEFMTEKLGAEEAGKMFADFASGYSGSEYTVWKFHPGMSATPDED